MIEMEIQQLKDFFFIEHRGEVYRFLVESLEKPLLVKVLAYTRGNQLEAARVLGINRNTLRTKIKKLGIRRD